MEKLGKEVRKTHFRGEGSLVQASERGLDCVIAFIIELKLR